MFLNRSTLNSSLQGLVGAHQTVNPEYPTIATSLLVSRSGRYWMDESPLLKIENINECFTNYSHFNYDDYSGATEYELYDKVKEGGVNYEYINATPSTGNTPPNATYWSVIDPLSDYLLQLDYKASDLTLDSVMNMKKIKGQVKSIFNNVQLFKGRDEYTNLETNSGKMVGLRLTLKDHTGLITILHKLSHQFNAALEDLTIYIFHTSQQDALTTFTIDHTTAKSSQWTSLSNYILRYLSDSHDVGGDFYLAYFQDDLGEVQAIKKDIRWDLFNPCCDIKRDYKIYSEFVDVVGFSFQSSDLNGIKLPDPEDIYIDYYSNFGLNLQLTTKCDLTPFILSRKNYLAEVKSLNMAYLVMKDLAYNTRGSNSQANQVKQMCQKQLYTFKDTYGTLLDRLKSATKGLDFDLSGLNSACLPCNDRIMVDYGGV